MSTSCQLGCVALFHLDAIYPKQEEKSCIKISKHREVGCENEAQPSFINRLGGVWTPDATLFGVFAIAFQIKRVSNLNVAFQFEQILCKITITYSKILFDLKQESVTTRMGTPSRLCNPDEAFFSFRFC